MIFIYKERNRKTLAMTVTEGKGTTSPIALKIGS